MTDYDFYANAYLGSSIEPEEFPAYALRAAEQLGRYRRIYTVAVPEDMPDGEDRAICAMAGALDGFDPSANGDGGPGPSPYFINISCGRRTTL